MMFISSKSTCNNHKICELETTTHYSTSKLFSKQTFFCTLCFYTQSLLQIKSYASRAESSISEYWGKVLYYSQTGPCYSVLIKMEILKTTLSESQYLLVHMILPSTQKFQKHVPSATQHPKMPNYICPKQHCCYVVNLIFRLTASMDF